MPRSIAGIVLAAGKGTRMKSERAKVLHEVFFRPMVHHVLDAVTDAGTDRCAVIVGHQREAVCAALAGFNVTPVVQEEQLGTGHAVLCAEQACAGADLVLILCGDTPLIRAETLQAMLDTHCRQQATLTLMTTVVEEPFGYGRILVDATGEADEAGMLAGAVIVESCRLAAGLGERSRRRLAHRPMRAAFQAAGVAAGLPEHAERGLRMQLLAGMRGDRERDPRQHRRDGDRGRRRRLDQGRAGGAARCGA